MQCRQILGLLIGLSLPLSGCGALLNELLLTPEEKLDQQIALERKKLELEQLRQHTQPQPSTPPTASPKTRPALPLNQSPQIQRLEARLSTTLKAQDTVKILAEARDPDGDPLEYHWSSVYQGLSADKGQEVVWYPGEQDLRGKTNTITLSVSDKKGGTSTGSLNIFIQSDGSLLVREDTAAQPRLIALVATRTTEGKVLLRASGTDPQGGTLRYAWTASQGLISSPSTASTTWFSPDASLSGEIVITLKLTNSNGQSTEGNFRFQRLADGSLHGGFSGTPTAPALESGQQLPISADPAEIPVIGSILGIENGEVFLQSLSNRTRTTLLNRAEFATSRPPTILALSADPQQNKAWLLTTANAQGQYPVFSLDLKTRALTQEAIINPQQFANASLGSIRAFTLMNAGQGLVRLLAEVELPSNYPRANKRAWLLFSPGGEAQILPEGLRPVALSAQGHLAGVRGEQLMRWDPTTQKESLLLDLKSSGLGTGLPEISWDHAGQRLAIFAHQALYLLSAEGGLRKLLDIDSMRGLAWSADDLHLSFMQYPNRDRQYLIEGRGKLRLVDVERARLLPETGFSYRNLGASFSDQPIYLWMP